MLGSRHSSYSTMTTGSHPFPVRQTLTPVVLPPIDVNHDIDAIVFSTRAKRPSMLSSWQSEPDVRKRYNSVVSSTSGKENRKHCDSIASSQMHAPPPLPGTTIERPDTPTHEVITGRIDMASYSAYPPTQHFAGSPDPYGLNAFLLPPDEVYEGIDMATQIPRNSSMPDLGALYRREGMSSSASSMRSNVSSMMDNSSASPNASSINLNLTATGTGTTAARRPSPLGLQSPVRPQREALGRRRSATTHMGSYDALLSGHFGLPVEMRKRSESQVRSGKSGGGSRGLDKLKSFGKRSVENLKALAGASRPASPAPPVPALPTSARMRATPTPTSTSAFLNPTTPMSSTSRSSSGGTAMSSGSSAYSSDGLRTPLDQPPVQHRYQQPNVNVGIAGSKLADALQQAEPYTSRERKKSLAGWFDGMGMRRPTMSKAPSTSERSSGPPTPAYSAAPSPMPSTADLPALLLTPSPDNIVTPPLQSSAQLEATARRGELMRKKSIDKLRTIAQPSPHPLAMHVRRDALCNPAELAMTINTQVQGQQPVCKRVFPNSVNSHELAETISPTHVGLWPSVAVKTVLTDLDNGETVPFGDDEETDKGNEEQPRQQLRRQNTSQARGVADFVNRPPFEDRNVVYYQGESWSPVSMARPGHGIESIEHSNYMVALSQTDVQSGPWPVVPRQSISGMDDLAPSGTTAALRLSEPPSPACTAVEQHHSIAESSQAGEISITSSMDAIDLGHAHPAAATSDETAPTTLDGLARLIIHNLTELDQMEDDEEDEPLSAVSARQPRARGTPLYSPQKVQPTDSTNAKLNMRIEAEKSKKAARRAAVCEPSHQNQDSSHQEASAAEYEQQAMLPKQQQQQQTPTRPPLRSASTYHDAYDGLLESSPRRQHRPSVTRHATAPVPAPVHAHAHGPSTPRRGHKRNSSYYSSPAASPQRSPPRPQSAWGMPLGQSHYQGSRSGSSTAAYAQPHPGMYHHRQRAPSQYDSRQPSYIYSATAQPQPQPIPYMIPHASPRRGGSRIV